MHDQHNESAVPFVDTTQMAEVDRAMIEDYGIDLIQMMENAGRNLAHLTRTRFLKGDPRGRRILILAGSGGNGGGALVTGRRLHNWGAKVEVALAQDVDAMTPVPRHQLDIVQRLEIKGTQAPAVITELDRVLSASSFDVILDGLIGYSLRGAPRNLAGRLIHWANSSGVPILALDTPSGVDTTTGRVFHPAIAAAATMTLALPKKGLRAEGIRAQVGELYLADISVPPSLYAEPALGLDVGALFARDDIIRIW